MSSRGEEVWEVLEQISKYTEQLSCCEKNPDLDVYALSLALEERFRVLKETFASLRISDVGQPEDHEMLKNLRARVEDCIETLKRQRDRLANELSSLSLTKRAARAYQNQR